MTLTQFNSQLKTAALAYANRGWQVLPLGYKSKIPVTQHGLLDATNDPNKMANWVNFGGIGIRTGKISNLIVVDIDAKNGGKETLKTLSDQYPGSLRTFRVATGGGGYHLYFKALEGQIIRNKQGLYPGIDIRGENGYVVAPPSLHKLGEYKVIDDIGISDIPSWLVDKLTEPAKQVSFEQTGTDERGWLKDSTKGFLIWGAQRGDWHERFIKAAFDMRIQGYTFEEARKLLAKPTGFLDDTDEKQLLDIYSNREVDVQLTEPIKIVKPSLVIMPKDLIKDTIDFLSDKDQVCGEATGCKGLDSLLGGGKRLGELTVWHAESKVGKNTLWHWLMHQWLSKDIALGYASRELSPETEVIPNLLSIECEENAWLSNVNQEREHKYRQVIAKMPLYFAKGYGEFPLSALYDWVLEVKQLGVRYFWFDHLHYMLQEPEDHKAASKLIKEIKAMAKTENIHIDLIVQPNKLLDGQRLSLGSLKGGAAIGQALDNLLILRRVRESPTPNIMEIKLEVGRSKLCKPGTIYLQYYPNTTCFKEVNKQKLEEHSDAPKRNT